MGGKLTSRTKEVEINGYIVTFDYDTGQCRMRRSDGKKIDNNSSKFKNDLLAIKKTAIYKENYNLMNLNGKKETNTFSKEENERLLEFTKSLLRQ